MPCGSGRTLTGAWIETLICPLWPRAVAGRTLTGAWIETEPMVIMDWYFSSHPHGCVD